MSLTNPNTPISEQDLHNFYLKIKPYLGINEMPAADLPEIMDPPPAVANQMPVLFDETGAERQVGWYKNSAGLKKPVYEKDFVFTISSTNTNWAEHVSNTFNMEKVIKYSVFGERSDCYYDISINYNSWTVQGCFYFIWQKDNPDDLYFFHRGSNGAIGTVRYIIQFTKTTDEFA